jgi:carboxymethylenebutenolidase
MSRKVSGLSGKPRSIVQGQVKIAADDDQCEAYLAAPDTSTDAGPGVIVVTHIFGVDQDTKDICDELATRGCVAIAPNFFWRDSDPGVLVEAEVPRAIARAMRIDFAKSMDDLKLAVVQVRNHPGCNGKIVVLGYCFGGPYAWRSACDELGVDAAVSFQGTFVSKYMKPDDKPGCPVSFHYGENDYLAPPPELAAVKSMADVTGCEVIVHPGAGHGYMMPGNSHYQEEAANKSWNVALKMIKELQM